jgi:hypothetical protein
MANLGQRLFAPESAQEPEHTRLQGELFLSPCSALELFIQHSAAKTIRVRPVEDNR